MNAQAFSFEEEVKKIIGCFQFNSIRLTNRFLETDASIIFAVAYNYVIFVRWHSYSFMRQIHVKQCGEFSELTAIVLRIALEP